jgi:hypothetical protein
MPNYCLNQNAQSNGDHEVHDLASTKGCLPAVEHRIALGSFLNCAGAVAEAKRRYPNARINGCYYCAYACNTG